MTMMPSDSTSRRRRSQVCRLLAPHRPQDEEDEALLAAARRAAAEHQDQHGQPITRDALRARLGVSTQAASDLLRQLRATKETLPPGVSRIDPARRGLKGEQP